MTQATNPAGKELLEAVASLKPHQVSSVIEKFCGKYGAGDVKKYYSKLDVAVLARLP